MLMAWWSRSGVTLMWCVTISLFKSRMMLCSAEMVGFQIRIGLGELMTSICRISVVYLA